MGWASRRAADLQRRDRVVGLPFRPIPDQVVAQLDPVTLRLMTPLPIGRPMVRRKRAPSPAETAEKGSVREH
jgi:hypothetical protein